MPPGWKPHSYPLKEYEDYLSLWSAVTSLEEKKIGPAIASRLEGPALKVALELKVQRINVTTGVTTWVIGASALALTKTDAVTDPGSGTVVIPEQQSGAWHLLARLRHLFALDDQDIAWTTLDKFFGYTQGNTDFQLYVVEFDRFYQDAEVNAVLEMNEVARCCFFWSKSNLSVKDLSDLRLKVDGDMSRWREMVRIWLKITKNEEAATDQSRGYRQFHEQEALEYGDEKWPDEEERYETESYYDDSADYYDCEYDEEDYIVEDEWSTAEYYDESGTAAESTAEDSSEAYKGAKGKKGKGKKGHKGGKAPSGQQCTKCGSRLHSEDHCPAGKGAGASESHYGEGDEDGYVDTWYDEETESYYDAYDVPVEDPEYGEYWQRRWYRRKGKGKKGRKGVKRGKGGKGAGKRAFPRSPFGRKSSGKGRKGKKPKGGKGWRRKGKGKGHYAEDGIHLSSHTSFAGMATTIEEEDEEYEDDDTVEQENTSEEVTTESSAAAEPVGFVPVSGPVTDEPEKDAKTTPKSNAMEAIFGTPQSSSSQLHEQQLTQPRPKGRSVSLMETLVAPPPGLSQPAASAASTPGSGAMLSSITPRAPPSSWLSAEATGPEANTPTNPITPTTAARPSVSPAVSPALPYPSASESVNFHWKMIMDDELGNTPPPKCARCGNPITRTGPMMPECTRCGKLFCHPRCYIGHTCIVPPGESEQEALTFEDSAPRKSEARLLESDAAPTPQQEESPDTVQSAEVQTTSDRSWTPDENWSKLRFCPTCGEVGEWKFICDWCGVHCCSQACFGSGPFDNSTDLRLCQACKTPDSTPPELTVGVISEGSQSFYSFFATHSYAVDYSCVQPSLPDNEFVAMMKECGMPYDPQWDCCEDAEPQACCFLYTHTCFNQSSKMHHSVFTSVRGQQQAGLLIDPGASKALIGMDSLKKIMDNVLRPKGMLKYMTWATSTATFQGINPTPEHSLGVVSFPIGLEGISGSRYVADVIGGPSTLCPGLVPLRTLAALHACIMCGHYKNGDGIMGLWHQNAWHPQHLHRTDSGHYLLRIDHFSKDSHNNSHKTAATLQQTTKELERVARKNESERDQGHARWPVTLHSSWQDHSNQGAWTETSYYPQKKSAPPVFH